MSQRKIAVGTLVLACAWLLGCPKEGGGAPTGTLKVLAVGPSGEVTGPVQVYATFDQPVVKLGEANDSRAHEFLRVTPEKPGQYRFLGTQTVVFEFTGNAPRSSEFKAEVPVSARSVDGAAPAAPVSTTFTTLKLRLNETTPRADFKQAPSKPVFTLMFNQPVDAGDVTRAVTFQAAGGQPQAAKCEPAPKDAAPNSVTCTASSEFAPSAAMTLRVAGSLHGAEGTLPMGEDATVAFTIHGPAGVASLSCETACRPEYGARIVFATPVVAKELKPFITVTPAPETSFLDGDYPSETIYLPRLKPSTHYTVVVKEGAPDHFGQKLSSEKTLTLDTAAATPRASMPAGELTMEPGNHVLRLRTVNAKSAQVRLWKVADGEAPSLAGAFAHGSDSKRRAPDVTSTLSIPMKQNVETETTVDLAPALSNGKGLVAFSVTFPDVMAWGNHVEVREGFAQVTSMGVSMKTWGSSALTWVTDLSSGKPVSGATVTIMEEDGRTAWTGTTDDAGLAVAANVGRDAAERGFALVHKGDDVALGATRYDNGLSVWDLGGMAAYGEDANVTGLIFTDRGVYRPGETVHIKALVRLLEQGELKVPANTPATLEVTGPTGDNAFKRNFKLGALGTGNLDFPVDNGAKLGSYTLHLMVGSDERSLYTNIMVEQFKAPDFKVEVTAPKPQVMRGEDVAFTGTASYLFGAPLVGASVKYAINANPASFTPPGVEGFVFSDETLWLSDSVYGGKQLLSADGTSDKGGAVTFHTAAQLEQMTGPMNAVAEVTAVDPSGQAITGTTSVLIHPGTHYLGLRTAGSMSKAGEALNVEAVGVTPEGKPANASADAVLRRREYKAVKQQGVGESTETLQSYEDKEVARCALSGLGVDVKSCSVTPKEPGLHLLSLEGKDSKGNALRSATVVWVFGPGEAPWAADETMAVKLVADKKNYKPGDVARILVQNPFPGAQAMVTVERGGIYDKKILSFTGNAPTLEIPIEDRFVPNVYVGVLIVKGRTSTPKAGQPDRDKPAVRGGYVLLNVDPGVRRLNVAVTPNAAEYGPRDKVTVKVDLKDAAGAGTAGEVALFVVDESVLQLTGFKTPDPISILYSTRGISVHTSDTRINLVDTRSYGEKGEEEGGGGLGALLGDETVRGRFMTCAYFNPSIKVPAGGSTDVTFDLPDNLTAFRLMALAVSDGNRFGSAENKLRVKKPLMLRPASSRLLRVGDQAQLGVVVVNTTSTGGTVELQLENKTPDLIKLTQTTGSVQADVNASVPFRVQVEAQQTGTAILRFAARMGSASDSVEIRVPVSQPMPLIHDATYGAVEPGTPVNVPLSVPADARPEFGGLTVSLSTTLLTGLSGAAVQLRSYPYDCVEQTASKLLPFVELAALQSVFGVSSAEAAKTQGTAVLNKLLGFQNEDGGMGLWPGLRSSPWYTAYAVLVLARASDAGFKVPAQSLHRAQGYLKGALKEWDANKSDRYATEWAALVVDVLATLKDPVPAYASRLFEQREKLTLDARALLLHALALNGNARQVKPLTDDLASHVHQSAQGAQVQAGEQEVGYLGSPARTHGLVLRALVATGQQQALSEKLAVGLLARQNKGSYRTTQEAGWALLSLRDYQQTYETGDANVDAQAMVGTNAVAKASFRGMTLETITGTAPLGALKGAPLTITSTGTGTVRYGATLSHVPRAVPSVPQERGMFVERTLFLNKQKVQNYAAPAGQLFQMRVDVATPMDRNQVVVDIPVPAGMELVNTRFATSETVPPMDQGQATPAADDDYEGEEGGGGPRVDLLLQGYFDHVELRDDRLLLFAQTLPRGVHRYVVGVRSVTPGRYVLAPAHVEEMYNPEVFGSSAGGTFTVEAGGK